MSDPQSQTTLTNIPASTGKVFGLTPRLRWARRYILNREGDATAVAHDRLQQAWQCVETGELDWRDVERE